MFRTKKVVFLPDKSGWVTSWEQAAIRDILNQINIEAKVSNFSLFHSVYFSDKYQAASLAHIYNYLGNCGVFDYFHGDPTISPEAGPLLKKIIQKRSCFSRIRVSHSGMESMLHSAGLGDLAYRIPIGINLDWFPSRTLENKEQSRKRLKIPDHAVVIGSFQKDGEGWGEGMSPKLIKGPDLLLETLGVLSQRVPELFVLLTGPSRGFVKSGLNRLKIPFKHYNVPQYPDLGMLYHALDGYLITAREEGGPKAVLESMATGIPLVTTKVGQAQDLVEHEHTGWLAESGTAEELAELMFHCLEQPITREQIRRARNTAEANSYLEQKPLWREFFTY